MSSTQGGVPARSRLSWPRSLSAEPTSRRGWLGPSISTPTRSVAVRMRRPGPIGADVRRRHPRFSEHVSGVDCRSGQVWAGPLTGFRAWTGGPRVTGGLREHRFRHASASAKPGMYMATARARPGHGQGSDQAATRPPDSLVRPHLGPGTRAGSGPGRTTLIPSGRGPPRTVWAPSACHGASVKIVVGLGNPGS